MRAAHASCVVRGRRPEVRPVDRGAEGAYNDMSDDRAGRQRRAAVLQTAYYLPTGIWPLIPFVGIRTFEVLTGPKTDRWLVQTVGALVTVIGAVIGRAGSRRRVTPEVELLAVGTALSLATVDVVFVARRRIRPVYLLDALTNLWFAETWRRTRM